MVAMWQAFNDLAQNKTSAVNSDFFFFSACFFDGSAVIYPECRPSRLHGKRDRTIILLLCLSMIKLTLGVNIHLTAGHLGNTIKQR